MLRLIKRPVNRGFSLLEAMVALLLLTVIIGAFLAMLNTFSGLVKIQGNIADTTENMRYTMAALVRVTRMAGTGGLPVVYPDSTGNLVPLAVDVANNVSASTNLPSAISGADWTSSARDAVPGTDALRIQGVITSPQYDIFGGNFNVPSGPTQLDVPRISPWSTDPLNPIIQDEIGQLDDRSHRPFLISLQFPLDITPSIGGLRRYASYRIVSVTGVDTTPLPNSVDLTFNDDPYKSFNPGGVAPVTSNQAYAAGYLDDLIFYVAPNAFGEPSLYRLRLAATGGYTAEELVPNVSDFQVALGCDINVDGSLTADEWYLSEATPGPPSADQLASLREVRLSVVSRTQDPDLKWTADADMPENAANLSGDDLHYRYRTITVRVALRSHPQLTS